MINTGFREKISRLFSRAVVYILWALFAFFLWTFVFNGISDTSRDKKVTLYINALEVAIECAVTIEEAQQWAKAHNMQYPLQSQYVVSGSSVPVTRGGSSGTGTAGSPAGN